jgi:hypothetical protein
MLPSLRTHLPVSCASFRVIEKLLQEVPFDPRHHSGGSSSLTLSHDELRRITQLTDPAWHHCVGSNMSAMIASRYFSGKRDNFWSKIECQSAASSCVAIFGLAAELLHRLDGAGVARDIDGDGRLGVGTGGVENT